MKKLIKSYKFWTALAGAVGILLVALSDTLGIKINASGVEQVIMAVCGILVVFGIVQKPKNTPLKTEEKTEQEKNTK